MNLFPIVPKDRHDMLITYQWMYSAYESAIKRALREERGIPGLCKVHGILVKDESITWTEDLQLHREIWSHIHEKSYYPDYRVYFGPNLNIRIRFEWLRDQILKYNNNEPIFSFYGRIMYDPDITIAEIIREFPYIKEILVEL